MSVEGPVNSDSSETIPTGAPAAANRNGRRALLVCRGTHLAVEFLDFRLQFIPVV
jgi:hypothetical protein